MSESSPNMLGSYGPWAAALRGRAGEPLSALSGRWDEPGPWRAAARRTFRDLTGLELLRESSEARTDAWRVETTDSFSYDGLQIERLRWRLPYGPETHAVFLKPKGAEGPLPGVLGLHDHGGVKYFGWEKIARVGDSEHPFLGPYRETLYGGVAWANALARRGYGVLVHDAFVFGSRRINPSELPRLLVERLTGSPDAVKELKPGDVEDRETTSAFDVSQDATLSEIDAYHVFTRAHEDIIAKSLFSAGLTWPAVYLNEDLVALDYLCSRADVDPKKIGCCGLSGGGLRTNYLAGLDDRIRCSVTAGFMTTWTDLILHRCFTHTWMVYVPRLPTLMEYPEILAMRAPLPAMVLATEDDPLFTLSEVRRAGDVLERVYEWAGARDNLRISVHPGHHQFNPPMQDEAFAWLDRWLRLNGD